MGYQHHKNKDEYETELTLGTLRQMAFFGALDAAGIPKEYCVSILAKTFSLSDQAAQELLCRIGHNHNSDEPIPADLEAYLVEKGRRLLPL